MTTLWQVDIVHLHADRVIDYLNHLPKATDFFKKIGVSEAHSYWTEAGGAPEVVNMVKFDSFDHRNKIMEKYMKEPEFLGLLKGMGGPIASIESFVCSTIPEIGVNQSINNPKSKKILEMIKVNDVTQIVATLKDAVAVWEQKMGDKFPEMLIALHPVFFSSHCNVICLFEMPENVDAVLTQRWKVLTDRNNWPKLSAQAKDLEVQATRCINPIGNLKFS